MKVQGVLVPAVLALAVIAPAYAQPEAPPVPVVGGPCEGCENVFVGIPDGIPAATRIAPADQPGEPMRIEGTVRRADGAPAAGVIVYGYHTDDGGIYPDGSTFHGSLRAWAKTDAGGRYRFDTIRPASYPNASIPAHVHMHVIEPERCTYWIDSIEFTDDPLLPEDARENVGDARGGNGVVAPGKVDGTWVVTRDIILGKNVPGYPE